MAKMIGKADQPPCGSKCCGEPSKSKSHKRKNKRAEKQAWKKEIA